MLRAYYIAALFIWLLITGMAFAGFPSSGQKYPPGPVVYQGGCDVVSGCTACWALRACTLAYATGSNPSVTVCDQATGLTCSTINILASGDFDTATASGSAACVSACSATTIYDQVGASNCGGSCNLLTALVGNAPALVFNCLGSFPCLQWITQGGAVSGRSTAAGSYTPATGVVSMSTVAYREGHGATAILLNSNAANNRFQGTNNANQWEIINSGGTSILKTATDKVFHAAQGVINGASSAINIDGAEATGSISGNTTAGAPQIGTSATNTSIEEVETAMWDNVAFSSGQRTSECHNQYAYWGTATSC